MPAEQERKVSEFSEAILLEKCLRLVPTRGAVVVEGPGDDCALLRGSHSGDWRVFKTDAVVEAVHFLPDAPASAVGWKALCRVLSDLAAMGATPEAALVTVALPGDTPLAWLTGLYRGLGKAAREFACPIVGGETTRSLSGRWVSIAMSGSVPRGDAAMRRGARVGDGIFVTGQLGGSGAGRHLRFTPRLKEGEWLARKGHVRAMMDLSDGLASDLPRMAAASGLEYLVDVEAVPRHRGASLEQALGEGEDYELLVTLPQVDEAEILRAWRQKFKLPLTRIGRWVSKGKGRVLPGRGYDHFQGAQDS